MAGEARYWHIVMYDVSNPTVLRKTNKLLKGWGRPLQYSVFRVRCTVAGLERLRCELEAILDPEDRLLIARLCDGCAGRVIMRGRDVVALLKDPPPFTAVWGAGSERGGVVGWSRRSASGVGRRRPTCLHVAARGGPRATGIMDPHASASARPVLTRFPREHVKLTRFRNGGGA